VGLAGGRRHHLHRPGDGALRPRPARPRARPHGRRREGQDRRSTPPCSAISRLPPPRGWLRTGQAARPC
jgi:hypothetical protein